MKDIMTQFTMKDSFLGNYQNLITQVVIPYQEKLLKDEIEGAEKSHAIENFVAAANKLEKKEQMEQFYGMVFQDSDVAKWLEAAAYSLRLQPDEELEKRCDEIIDLIGRAQHPNGYLNTYFTVKEPGREWTDLCEAHELYCAGHMMEAAVAYAESTGKKKLLSIMCKMADHIYEHFITKDTPGYPGHPEVELALVRLYHATGKNEYLELAKRFIDKRGVDSDFFVHESQNRDWTVWGSDGKNKEYAQNHLPVREQSKAVGHAVRAVYLYTGMAMVAKETGDNTLVEACKRLWKSITNQRMYITGGIGSTYDGEAFTKDYHLPNDTAYAETCASVGLMFFAKSMLELEKDSSYADTMERAFYNGVLAGMQQDGKSFFYVNPLEVVPGITGVVPNYKHVLSQRTKWFACACCPPNVARLITSMSRYAWSVEDNTVYSHLYVGGDLILSDSMKGILHVETEYPTEGSVRYTFEPENDVMQMTLAIRMPWWSKQTVIQMNGRSVSYEVKNGYAYLSGSFTKKDEVTVQFDMTVNRIYPSPRIAEDSGKVAFMRGPLVYCAEGVDNEQDVLGVVVDNQAECTVKGEPDFYGNYKLTVKGKRVEQMEGLYSLTKPKKSACDIRLIPYYTWGNRGETQMRVWIPEE